MKRNKMIALALAAVLILSCLAGCEGKNDPAGAAPADSGTAQGESGTASRSEGVPGSGDQTAGEAPSGAPAGEPGGEAPAARDGERLGRVTAVNGTEVTFEVMQMLRGGGRNEGFGNRDQEARPGQQGQQPSGMPSDQQGQQPPEMPSGQQGQQPPGIPSGQEGQQPPEMPSGQQGQQLPEMPAGQQGQQPPEMPSGQQGMGGRGDFPGRMGQSETLTLTLTEEQASGLAVGDLVRLTLDDQGALSSLEKLDPEQMGGRGGFPGGQGGMGGRDPQNGGKDGPGGFGGNASASGTAANTADSDRSGETFTASAADENALKVSGSAVTLTDLTLEKTGDGSDTESCDFYGINAGLLATDGAAVTVEGGSFTTDAAGANALFCYGSGTSLTVSDAVIRTAGRNSGGIQTAGGGTTAAENLDVETRGASAAAIRSDRGGGTVRVTGGTYVTHGTGSPAIYSTADVTVSGAALTAASSEAVVVEGKNSVTLQDCAVSGRMTGTYGGQSEENLQAVMIYQSMSGDAGVGKGSFVMEGGSLTAEAGDLFYVTNTKAEIRLSGVKLTPSGDGILLRAAGNDGSRGWGAQGSNGGSVVMTAADQVLTGTVLVDEISSLDLTLSDGSAWTGTVNPEGAAGRVSLTLEEGCSWTLTGDAWLTAFDGDTAAIETNGFHVYVGGTLLV